MSKELELFEQIIKSYTETFNMAIHRPKDTIVKWEGVEEIEKSLKALEIIKKKKVNVELLHICISLEEYNMEILPYGNMPLTQEEYDLLKEILNETLNRNY